MFPERNYKVSLSLLQLWTFAYVWLLNKPYENEVILREQKLTLKCCKRLKILIDFKEGFEPIPLGKGSGTA